MEHIFHLPGNYLDLGKEEVTSLFDIDNFDLIDRLFIVNLKSNSKFEKTSKRLAFTKSICKLLFECKVDKLIEAMKNYEWSSVYRGSFCLRINYFKDALTEKILIKKLPNASEQTRSQLTEKNLAKYIWSSVKNPKVDLKNPKTKIEMFSVENKVYCGLLIYENKENFELRKAHLRPFSHPSSLHPKLARALVNITGIKEQESLLDPFCGTGGFLIEAGLMDVKVIGYDISKNMVKGCKENLKQFNVKYHKIINKNALDIKDKVDYVVTDLPYGFNSNIYLKYNKKSIQNKSNKINLKTNKNQIKNIEMFYLKFLSKLRKVLKKKAVIIFPSYVDYKKLLKTAKFKIEKEFEVYVHRSLAREIVKIK